jgi:hypothetical protein
VHKDFVPPGQTVNEKFCCDVLRRLKENNRHERSIKMLQQFLSPATLQRTRPHVAPCVAALTSTKITSIPQPPYTPDFTRMFFSLFPKKKMKLNGRHFESNEQIEAESQDVINMLERSHFHQCFRSWKSRCDTRINTEGGYFKGNEGE